MLGGEIVRRSFPQEQSQAKRVDLLPPKHFGVVGTMIEALAIIEIYRPKDEDELSRNGGCN